MAEGLMRHESGGTADVFSAGTKPSGLRPEAVSVMAEIGIDISDGRSKSVDEFTGQSFDCVITVCDNAAGEVCPVWPGQPMTAHWGIPDPAAVEGSDVKKMTAFRQAFRAMETRIKLFLSLPLASIDSLRLKQRMDAIGKTLDTPQS